MLRLLSFLSGLAETHDPVHERPRMARLRGKPNFMMGKLFRTAQTYVPALVDAKAWAQRTVRRTLRIPSEASYKAFERFPLEDGATFLDIGANRGQTIDSIRLYRSNVPILSFEPNPLLARRLRDRYSHDVNTTIQSFGLGAEPGEFDLHVPSYRGFIFDGLASFDRAAAQDWLNDERIYGFNPHQVKVETFRCEVRRWDDIVTRPGFVKIDVQGYESNVLLGGLTTIREHRPVFVIENDEVRSHERILFAENYRRAAFNGTAFVLDEVGHGNTFYIPVEKSERIQSAYK